MSKKSKKARRPNVPLYTGPVAAAQPTAQPTSGGGGEAATAIPRSTGSRETIAADYTPIIKDLKRIGLLAGVLFAVLVGLSFFIR